MKIEITSVLQRCQNVISSPTFTFELLFLIFLHFINFHSYFTFLSLLLLLQFISEVVSLGEKQKRLNRLTQKNSKVMVIRKDKDGISKKQIINNEELVPGDLIEITNEMIVPADVVLLYGSCVVEQKGDQQ